MGAMGACLRLMSKTRDRCGCWGRLWWGWGDVEVFAVMIQ